MLTHDRLVRLCKARHVLRDVQVPAPSVAAVARRAAMSRYHFIRQFKALFGETPHQCRIRARLEHAKRLLASGNVQVTDVCMTVGFSSLGSFSALFMRRFGESPSSYKKPPCGHTGRAHSGLPLAIARALGARCAIFE